MPDREVTSITSRKDRVDPVTHMLAGVGVARAALNRMTGLATLTGVQVRSMLQLSLWWNPYLWTGMVETARSVKAMRVDSRSQDLDPQVEEQVRYKPEETPVTLAAKSSSLGRAYMNWARFPITETEPLESGGRGYVVRFKDLRFELAGRRADHSPWAIVRLNRDLTVTDMTFSSSQ